MSSTRLRLHVGMARRGTLWVATGEEKGEEGEATCVEGLLETKAEAVPHFAPVRLSPSPCQASDSTLSHSHYPLFLTLP